MQLGDRLLARRGDDRDSVIGRERSWTYKEFVSQVTLVASYLRENRIQRVLIHVPQGFASYALMWGAFLAGSTFCTIGDGTPIARVVSYRAYFEPDLIISEEKLDTSETPADFFDRIAPLYFPPLDRAPFVQPLSAAYVLFTSGSTGQPKGVMISRQSLESVTNFAISEYKITEGDVWAQYSSLGFDLSILDIFAAIASGAALVPIVSKGDKLMPARFIERYRITIWHSVPSAFELIARSGRLTKQTLASLRLVIFCGEQLFPTILEKIFAVRENLIAYNTYGPTEATVFCTYQKVSKSTLSALTRTTVSIGVAIPGSSVELHDVVDGVGELVIRGINVGQGYLSRDGTSGYVIEADASFPAAYRTGDYCQYVDGALYFVCRKDRQVKIFGNRVDLSEIDLQLRQHGCEGAVSVYDDQRIKSFVFGGSKTTEELLVALARQLPAYGVPAVIHKLEQFPYTLSGKVDINQLLKMERGGLV